MGFESRQYLRDEDDASFGTRRPSAPMSIVTKIIITTIAVFLLQNLGDSPIEEWMWLQAGPLFKGQIWRLLTYAFLHDTQSSMPWHILCNMYLLYVVGRVTAQLTGENEFLWFYCAATIFAGICSVCFYSLMNVAAVCVGASGAVLAVFCLLAMHYPHQKLYLFGVFGIEMRWLLAAYVVFDALPIVNHLATGQMQPGGIAHSAHLGGLLFGWLYFRWQLRFTAWWDRVRRQSRQRRARRTRLKVFKPLTQQEPDLKDRVDEILAKISTQGEESLTERERRILRQASEQLKKKR